MNDALCFLSFFLIPVYGFFIYTWFAPMYHLTKSVCRLINRDSNADAFYASMFIEMNDD